MEEQKYKLNSFAQEIEQEMRQESFKKQYYYENEYLNNHNHTCPLCKGKIRKNLKNILTGAHIVGMIQSEKQKVSISYTLCKKCSKKIMRATVQEKKTYENIISCHVITTIGI